MRGTASIERLSELEGLEFGAAWVGRFFWEGEEDVDATGPLVLKLGERVVELRGAAGGGDWLISAWRTALPEVARTLRGWAFRPVQRAQELIGRPLASTVPLVNRFGHVAGVRLVFGSSALTYLSQADEHYLLVGRDGDYVRKLGFTPGIVPRGDAS